MLNLEEYEKKCDEIRQLNDEYLLLFKKDLEFSGLAPRTIQRHISNVDFFINTYLLRETPQTMDKGIYDVDIFLGLFFIRKCGWSTPGTIRSTATSIKKFYKCMVDHGKVKDSAYKFLCSEIKENIKQWQDDCAMYNDPDAPNPFELEWEAMMAMIEE